MQFPRLPEWLTYGAVVAALTLAALGRRENANAPPAPPPLSKEEGALLSPASAFDHTVALKSGVAGAHPTSGSAFSVGDAGIWLTARHVVSGCARIAVIEAPGRGALARLAPERPLPEGLPDPVTDVAVLTTIGGAPALPLSKDEALRIGERGFHPGFPGGAPGEATSRLLGRETLALGARRGHDQGAAQRNAGARAEPVLVWAQAGRTEGIGLDLSGLSGAPVLDTKGEVMGLTLAQSPRRGRLYSTGPEALREALRRADVTPSQGASSEPITVENYGRQADTLRRDLRIAEVVCLTP